MFFHTKALGLTQAFLSTVSQLCVSLVANRWEGSISWPIAFSLYIAIHIGEWDCKIGGGGGGNRVSTTCAFCLLGDNKRIHLLVRSLRPQRKEEANAYVIFSWNYSAAYSPVQQSPQCVAGKGDCWVVSETIFCRTFTLCMWADSEPTKLLIHPKTNTKGGGGGGFKLINSCKKIL